MTRNKTDSSEYTRSDAEDDLVRGFRSAPDETELKAWSYVRVCNDLEQAKAGTTRYMVIETEKRRLDSLSETGKEAAQASINQERKEPTPDHWYKKPIPVIALSVTAGLVILGIKYILKHKYGVDL